MIVFPSTWITREAPVVVFVMQENRWRFEEDWPIARTVPMRFYLAPAGGLTTVAPHIVSAAP